MEAQQLREAFIEFFKSKGHAQIGSASLIPENDPTVLFTTAGMHPLVPYLLGEKHPMGRRLCDFQKCIRTGDIDEVGDASHLTFFEMLGNWSLGDYFKKESIGWSFEFLTEHLGFRPEQLAVTAFKGEGEIPRDDETADLWRSHGLKDDQIFFYGREDNWWGPAGVTGPCGPDTEIFYDDGRPKCCDECGPSCHCGKYTEIWNNVFMEYFKDENGRFTPLKQKNVDTGMGLERVCRITEGKETVYDTSLFTGIIGKLEGIVDQYGPNYPELIRAREDIKRNITAEEEKFHKTLSKGLRRFNEMVSENAGKEVLDGEAVFRLYDTFGFPVELTDELAREQGLKVDLDDFDRRFREHQEKSRAGAEQTFKGGLADHSEETTKLHTATHLLNAALRNLIDPDIRQKGSNITADRLRFDFNFDRKLTPEELKSIEDYVNDAIRKDIPVVCREMPVAEAKASGAIGVFDDKYGAIVKVYSIGDISSELCGGPHVTHTGELQGFKIKKEESSAAGVRRIKAVVGKFD